MNSNDGDFLKIKILQKKVESTKICSADKMVCIPLEQYLEMLNLINGIPNAAGRAVKLLSKLPKIK